LGAVLGTLYVLGGAGLSLEAARSIHQHGFAFPPWPILSSSVAVARALNSFSDSTALTDVPVYIKAPQAVRALRLLLPPSASVRKSSGGLFITRNPPLPRTPGEAIVLELGPDVALSPNARQIDISPLPEGWVPDPSTW
jgi:hypothetical protein